MSTPSTPSTPPPPPSPPPLPPRPARAPDAGSGASPWLRPTIRIRLTLLYGAMFLMAGVVLLVIIYLLAARGMTAASEPLFTLVEGSRVQLTSNACPGLRVPDLSPQEFNAILEACEQHQRQEALGTLLRHSLLTLVGLTVVAFALGYAVAGRVLAPLGRITRTARRVAGSDLSRRIELEGPDDELKELADTFDDMLDRLDRAFEAQRRFVANASHELRTPLAINRTLLEVQLADPDAPPEVVQLGKTLLATNERSEQLVEGLLLLARSENQLVDRRPVDLAEAASQAVEQTRDEARRRGVELRGERQPVVVQGNGVLLERVALNLVENAVRYNLPQGGWVSVTTRALPGQALLVVENTGPVVPAYELDALFEPFRRLRKDRTGSDRGVGLGLSIVRSVARAHGGTVTAEPRRDGGLVMRVALPV